MSHDSNHNVGKLSKFTRLFNAVVYKTFLSNCKCLIYGQEDDQAAYDLSPSR